MYLYDNAKVSAQWIYINEEITTKENSEIGRVSYSA